MDPHERAQLEQQQAIQREGALQATPGIRNLRAAYRKMYDTAAGLVHSEEPANMEVVNQTKSSPIADYVRRHPRTPFVARICLAVLALVLGGYATRKLTQKYPER
jgi:hypothetical protein